MSVRRAPGENEYQRHLIKKLEELLPGCIVIKNDPNFIQGIPDLLVLWGDKWAALEVKASARAIVQPNQENYILLMDAMSFAAFICPENEKEVLDAVQHAFGSRGASRISKRQQVSLGELRSRQANRRIS